MWTHRDQIGINLHLDFEQDEASDDSNILYPAVFLLGFTTRQ
jgi:hypothetical protein